MTVARALFNYGESQQQPMQAIPQPPLVDVTWDAADFAAASVAHNVPADAPLSPAPVDHELMSRFPTPLLGPFEEPSTLVDCHGRILLWYLPGILDSAANVSSHVDLHNQLFADSNPQDTVMKATQCLEMGHPKKPMGSAWRSSNFYKGTELPSGCQDFSPAWFPQGHTVSFMSHGCWGY